MRIAFYAPLKPPHHPVPSGDRRIAGLLMDALDRGGHDVELASPFRSWDGAGDGGRQARLRRLGGRLARRLVRRYRGRPLAERPALWFTYHLYHKAPDWLGPAVSAALSIPYVVAEASHAPKQAGGPWDAGHRAAAAAIAAARRVICLNAADADCVRPLLAAADRLVPLAPFIDTQPFSRAATDRQKHRRQLAGELGLDTDRPWLAAAAMMRRGDKFESYRVLADALARIRDQAWQIILVGDGEARGEVEALFADLPAARVRFAGERPPEDLPAILAASDIYVWPAIREAFGMALLEAQAAGLPVVAGAVGGVPDIVADGATGVLTPDGDVAALADAIARLLGDRALRRSLGAAAHDAARDRHDVRPAAAALDRIVNAAVAAASA